MVIPHHTGSVIRTLIMGVKEILSKPVPSHYQWALWVTNVWPLTTDFTLHNTVLIIHCQPSLENSSAIFCIIGFVILIIFWLPL